MEEQNQKRDAKDYDCTDEANVLEGATNGIKLSSEISLAVGSVILCVINASRRVLSHAADKGFAGTSEHKGVTVEEWGFTCVLIKILGSEGVDLVTVGGKQCWLE